MLHTGCTDRLCVVILYFGSGVELTRCDVKVAVTCRFMRRAPSCEEAAIMTVFTSDSRYSAESTKAMRIKCPAEGCSMLTQRTIELEPSD